MWLWLLPLVLPLVLCLMTNLNVCMQDKGHKPSLETNHVINNYRNLQNIIACGNLDKLIL